MDPFWSLKEQLLLQHLWRSNSPIPFFKEQLLLQLFTSYQSLGPFHSLKELFLYNS